MSMYIRDANGDPQKEPDTIAWAKWFEGGDDMRRVAWDESGPSVVSTVFLGIDHAFHGGPPLLWETMVFGGPLDMEQQRYTSQEAALEGHREMVEAVKKAAGL